MAALFDVGQCKIRPLFYFVRLYMSQYFEIHPDNPQQRLIKQAVEIINQGGVIVYPTDSSYALGCQIGDKDALIRMRRIRQVDDKHNLTLVCRDLSEIATYAKIENADYRLLKSLTPGPYTFILAGTSEVPRRIMHPKRRHIGLRVMDHPIVNALLAELGQPLMSCTLIMPGEELPVTDAEDIRSQLEKQVDLIIDGGPCGIEPTTVIRLTEGSPQILRHGKGKDHGIQE
jgi:tRNA threonylcarbamoyl adenosine modification protein (Sua5/YciO/YrdC/YwlC family)